MASKSLDLAIIRARAKEVYGNNYKVLNMKRHETNRDYILTIKCNNCEAERQIMNRQFLLGKSGCKCMKPGYMRKTAVEYAKELFVETDRGLIVGEELEEYIKQCITYDYPLLAGSVDFQYFVEDAVLALYEKKQVRRCKRCKGWFSKASYRNANTVCNYCLEGRI